MRNRNHKFWKAYEISTAIAVCITVITMVLFTYNISASFFGFKPFLAELNNGLVYALFGSLVWVKKFDLIKYKITKDPRDEPFRKWFSFKHAQKFKPGERVFIPDNYTGDTSILDTRICPKCGHSQKVTITKSEPQICGIYGCKQTI